MICVWLLRAPTFAELKPTRQALRTSPLGGLSARSAFRRSLRSRRNRRARASQRTRGAHFGRQVARRLRCFAPAALATLGDSGICSGLRPQQAFLSASALPSAQYPFGFFRCSVVRHCRAILTLSGFCLFRTAVRFVRFAGSQHLPLLHDPCRGLSSGSAPTCAVSFGWGPRPSLERFVGPPPLLSVPARYARAPRRGSGQGRAVSRFAGRFFSADALWPKNAGLALRATVPRETLGTDARVFGHKAPALLALIYLESLIEIVYTTTSPHPTTAGVVFDENSLYDICEREERTRA